MLHFKAKMHQIQFPLNSISQFQFPLGLRKRPRWGAYSAPPNPLAGFKGPTSKGREGKEGKEGEGMRKGDGIGGKGRVWGGRGKVKGKERGYGGARKVVCPGARAGSRRAWLKAWNVLYASTYLNLSTASFKYLRHDNASILYIYSTGLGTKFLGSTILNFGFLRHVGHLRN